MRKVCLINNYNYGKYLGSCLHSVVNQTVRFDAVYIVDDGSTDDSKEIINDYSNNFSEITPIYKINGGQLSCFNVAVDFIKDDDLVFLLDSDDFYPKDYLEKFLEICRLSKYGMYFCNPRYFERNDAPPETSVIDDAPIVVISNSSHLTQLTKCWVGKPTSSMMVTGELFRQIFPYPHESDWITRADDILVYASSLAGYAKVFIPSLCVGYRRHGENSFVGKSFNKRYRKKRKRAVHTLFLWCYEKYSLKRIPSLVSAIDEYESSKEYYGMIGKIKVWKIYIKYMTYMFSELFYLRKTPNALNEE